MQLFEDTTENPSGFFCHPYHRIATEKVAPTAMSPAIFHPGKTAADAFFKPVDRRKENPPYISMAEVQKYGIGC